MSSFPHWWSLWKTSYSLTFKLTVLVSKGLLLDWGNSFFVSNLLKFYQELVLRLVNIFHILLWSNNFLFTLLRWVISIDFKNYFTIYFYVYVCFPFMFICASRACGAPAGQKRACRSPWDWSYTRLWGPWGHRKSDPGPQN